MSNEIYNLWNDMEMKEEKECAMVNNVQSQKTGICNMFHD